MHTQPTFIKYPSLENHDREGFLDKLRLEGLTGGEWVVQEKAHGANLSFNSVDGQHWVTAKRTKLLEPDEAFFAHQLTLETYRERLGEAWRVLRQRYPAWRGQATIFGELVGGAHPDYPPDPVYKRVQRDIHYAPDHHFIAFDIWLEGVAYLGVDEANAVFDAAGLAFAKTRARGTFAEALAHPVEFNSRIPLELGFGRLTTNRAEGIVLRPVLPTYSHAGQRVIIKVKSERWADRNYAGRQKRKRTPRKLAGEVGRLAGVALAYATPARVGSAIGKVGEVTRADFGKLVGLIGQDIHADFMADHAAALAELGVNERKAVTKTIGTAATALVKEYFVELAP